MKVYYEEKGIQIFHGDCKEVVPFIKADSIITDPPYSCHAARGARTRNDGKFGGDNFVPFSITAEELRHVFSLCGRILERWLVASIDWRHALPLESDPPEGLKFIRAGCWVKSNSAPQFTGDRPAPGWEFIAILHSTKNKMAWNGGGSRAVWKSPVEIQNGHPTPKPLSLMRKWVNDFSDAGETILDPFMGSGTTLRAAKDLGRQAIGIEICEAYCEIAARRLQQEVLPLTA